MVLKKILALIILAVSFHYFVPLLNRAIDDHCCASGDMPCCQGDFPSQPVCCIDGEAQDTANAPPIQGKLEISTIVAKFFVLTEPLLIQSVKTPLFFYDKRHYFIPHKADESQRYLALSSFLI